MAIKRRTRNRSHISHEATTWILEHTEASCFQTGSSRGISHHLRSPFLFREALEPGSASNTGWRLFAWEPLWISLLQLLSWHGLLLSLLAFVSLQGMSALLHGSIHTSPGTINVSMRVEISIVTGCCFYSHALPTCIYNEDSCTGKGGGIKTTFVLIKVTTHHRAQNEANTRCCIEVSHHQGALWLRHQVRQQSSADGERVLKQPCNRKQCKNNSFKDPMCTCISIPCNVRRTFIKCNMKLCASRFGDFYTWCLVLILSDFLSKNKKCNLNKISNK